MSSLRGLQRFIEKNKTPELALHIDKIDIDKISIVDKIVLFGN